MVSMGGVIFLIMFVVVLIIYCVSLKLEFNEHEKRYKSNIQLLDDANYSLNEDVDQKRGSIAELFKMLEDNSNERLYYRARTLELERAIEQGYGVTIRKDVTVVNSDFTKLEMVVMFSGVHKLLKAPQTADDAEIYLGLIKKMQPIMDKMEEKE